MRELLKNPILILNPAYEKIQIHYRNREEQTSKLDLILCLGFKEQKFNPLENTLDYF
jgi:hypothetical protein